MEQARERSRSAMQQAWLNFIIRVGQFDIIAGVATPTLWIELPPAKQIDKRSSPDCMWMSCRVSTRYPFIGMWPLCLDGVMQK